MWATLPAALIIGGLSAATAYVHSGSLLFALLWFWIGAYALIGIVAVLFWLTVVR